MLTEIGDAVCVILGCSRPILLRRLEGSGEFLVINESYIHGLMYGEALLGTLPAPWSVHLFNGTESIYTAQYTNTETGEVDLDDPRLGDLPSEWEQLAVNRTANDPMHVVRFRNKTTGQTSNSDPRLLPDALRARGVPLETFRLH
jgi:hypothetical protein